ncbi:MAG: hypothetical protein KC978_00260 [Candidatus Omnitrophica bacterium]|nr:hypothetical protein [Candidatus Omnitrophota bacterium]
MIRPWLSLFLILLPVSSFAGEFEISVFAGNGQAEWTDLGQSATSTVLISPNGLDIDSASRVLIAEGETNQIFRVDKKGSIEVVAGCGFAGFAGDGGPATEAFLTKPYSVLAEASGSILIADQWNHRIRRVHSDQTIQTVVGNGEGFFGLGTYGGDGGPALKAGLNFPSGMCEGPDGSLYIADQMNGRVRKVDPKGTITSFASPTGKLKLPLKRPIDLEMTSDGKILMVDAANDQIYSVTPDGSADILIGPPISETMIPKHPGIYLNFPVAVEMARDGTLFWAETKNNRVCRLLPGESDPEVLMEGDKAPGIRIRGAAAKEEANRPKLGRPNDLLLLPDGALLIADPDAHRVWKVTFSDSDSSES